MIYPNQYNNVKIPQATHSINTLHSHKHKKLFVNVKHVSFKKSHAHYSHKTNKLSINVKQVKFSKKFM